jgi:hypothetical protein
VSSAETILAKLKAACVPFTREELEASKFTSDADYRRGYSHGYQDAMRDMRDVMHRRGYTRPREAWNILARFYDLVILPWRSSDLKRQIDPPRMVLPDSWLTVRKRVFERDAHACIQCGNVDGLECDHLLEVRRGGRSEMDNLRTLCGSCHRARKGEA